MQRHPASFAGWFWQNKKIKKSSPISYFGMISAPEVVAIKLICAQIKKPQHI